MENFDMDLSLGYEREDFDFGSQLSSASSARSFSTAPSCAPITPQSGRSTPRQHVPSMNFNSVTEYEFTPQESSMNDYFPADIKTEFPAGETFSTTPNKKPTGSPYSMDVENVDFLNAGSSSYGNMMNIGQPSFLEQLPFSSQMTSSPFCPPAPSYSVHNPPCDTSLWSYPFDNTLGLFDKAEPSNRTSSLRNISLQSKNPLPPPRYVANHPRRHLPLQTVRDKTTILHHVQGGGRISKKARYTNLGVPFKMEEAGRFPCDMPECVKQGKVYKRAEHLKRHAQLAHGNPECFDCEFCGKRFRGRKDNYKQHLGLHTNPNKSNTARTEYHPGAISTLEAEQAKTKRRNTQNKSPMMDDAASRMCNS